MFEPGSSEFNEDEIIIKRPSIFCALDGVTPLYPHTKGPRLFGEMKMTGGQFATDFVKKSFANATGEEKLISIFRRANDALREAILALGDLDLDDSAYLPSTTFAAIRIVGEQIEILQGGDTAIVAQMKDKTFWGTPIKMFGYDQCRRAEIAELRKKFGVDEMWTHFTPMLEKARRENMNILDGYSVINGQPSFEKCAQTYTLSLDQVDTMIIHTDGFVFYEIMENPVTLAQYVIGLYKTGGLREVLDISREIGKAKADLSHVRFEEAAAIAIKF